LSEESRHPTFFFCDGVGEGILCIRSTIPARTAALFIQSYTIGRVLLDAEPHSKKDETDWVNLIDQVMELAILQ
jgi:hypothetical protein